MKKAKLGTNGRMVIPKSIRKVMNIDNGSPIIITYEKGAVVVRSDKSACELCGSTIESERTLHLCDQCIIKAVKYHSQKRKKHTH